MISNEDKKDVSRAMGSKMAGRVARATNDAFRKGKTSGNYMTHEESEKAEAHYRSIAKARALKKAKSIGQQERESKKTGWYGAKGFDEHFVPKRYR